MSFSEIFNKKYSIFAVVVLLQSFFNSCINATSYDTTAPGRPEYGKFLDFYETVTLTNSEFLKGSIKLHNGIWCSWESSNPTPPGAFVNITEPIDGRIILGGSGWGITTSWDLYLGNNVRIRGGDNIPHPPLPVFNFGTISTKVVDGFVPTIHLTNDVIIDKGVTFYGDTSITINGNGNRLILENDAQFIPFGFCSFKNIVLHNVNINTYPITQYLNISFYNTKLYISGYFRPQASDFYIDGDTTFYGVPNSIIDFKGMYIHIRQSGRLIFDPNCNIKIGNCDPSLVYFANHATTKIFFDDYSSTLFFDSCRVDFENQEIVPFYPPLTPQPPFTKGNMIFNGHVNFFTTKLTYSIEIGDGNPINDPNLTFYANSKLIIGDNINFMLKMNS